MAARACRKVSIKKKFRSRLKCSKFVQLFDCRLCEIVSELKTFKKKNARCAYSSTEIQSFWLNAVHSYNQNTEQTINRRPATCSLPEKHFDLTRHCPKTVKNENAKPVWCRPRTSVQVNEPRYPRHSRAWQDHMYTPETYAQVTLHARDLWPSHMGTPRTCGQVTCARPGLVAKSHVHARDLWPSYMCTPGTCA